MTNQYTQEKDKFIFKLPFPVDGNIWRKNLRGLRLKCKLARIRSCMIIVQESTINKCPIKKWSSNYHVIFK